MAAYLIPELLQNVFCQIREQHGLQYLLPCLQVCHHWNDIASQVLYTHVVLTNHTLEPFIDASIKHSRDLTAMRSLSLQIEGIVHPEWIEDPELRESFRKEGYPQTQVLEARLRRLTKFILPKTLGLTTFSLFVSMPRPDKQPNFPQLGFRIDTKLLGELLRALPQGCVNLELDTDMTDWSPDDKPHHVCSDLWRLLPRLRHVKLRMYSLCSRMLFINSTDPDDRLNQPDFSRLEELNEKNLVMSDQVRTLSICTERRQYAGTTFTDCSYLQDSLNQGAQEPWPRGSFSRYCTPQTLAANLTAAYKAGRFPNAKLLEISQGSFRRPLETKKLRAAERNEIYRNVMLLRDCIGDVTLPQPLRRLDSGDNLALYDKTDSCVIGEKGDLLRHAEDTVWEETMYGARMPLVADTGVTPSDVQFKSPPRFMPREEWCQQSEFVMVGWRNEELEGQKIRRVVALPGADADYSMTKMKPLKGTQMAGRAIMDFGGYF